MDSDANVFGKIWMRQLRRLRRELRSGRPHADAALVNWALSYYENYYQARSELARSDPVRLFTAPWVTALERAAHWLGGWRPNLLVHLLYSECGLRFEAQLPDLLLGVRSGDLGDLESDQLARVDEVQRRTIREEVAVEEGMGEEVREVVAFSEAELEAKVEGVGRVVQRADELRLGTMRDLLGILKPLQAVDLLISAADLEISVHELGLQHERGMF